MLWGESIWQLHAFLENYGTKRFGASVSVYFHLSVGALPSYISSMGAGTTCDV